MRSSESMHRSMLHRVKCCCRVLYFAERRPCALDALRSQDADADMKHGHGQRQRGCGCLCGGEPLDIEVAAEACECLPSLHPATDTHTTLQVAAILSSIAREVITRTKPRDAA